MPPDLRRALTAVADTSAALLDLALPGGCAGCGASLAEAGVVGSGLCRGCAAGLAGPPRPAWPRPSPPGLPPPWAVAEYAGPVRAALLAHKEDGRRTLARALGAGLARAVLAAGPDGPMVGLVPVPSRRAAVRARGDDPTARLARSAAAALRRAGRPAQVLPALRPVRRVADQAGLGAADRAANLAGAFAVPRRLTPLVAGRVLVVVDDVVTTGASLAEAARALRAAGAEVPAAALVAATARRTPLRSG